MLEYLSEAEKTDFRLLLWTHSNHIVWCTVNDSTSILTEQDLEQRLGVNGLSTNTRSIEELLHEEKQKEEERRKLMFILQKNLQNLKKDLFKKDLLIIEILDCYRKELEKEKNILILVRFLIFESTWLNDENSDIIEIDNLIEEIRKIWKISIINLLVDHLEVKLEIMTTDNLLSLRTEQILTNWIIENIYDYFSDYLLYRKGIQDSFKNIADYIKIRPKNSKKN